MNKIFLGGTCAGTTWRDELVKNIKIDYFNPVVKDWTPDCIEEENIQKNILCNVHLYVITKEMTGTYSIAEAVESVFNKNKITIFQVIPEGFNKAQIKSFEAVCDIIKRNGGVAYIESNFDKLINFLNKVN